MPIPIFLTIFVIAVIVIQFILRRSNSNFENKKDEYLKMSQNADANIIKDSIDLPFVTPEISSLPFCEYPEEKGYKKITRKQKNVITKSKLTMIKLPENFSNIDLKMKYGSNNFEKVTLYEEHFNGFHRSLFDWATELIAINKKNDAITVLSYAIDFDTNISAVFKTLADLYSENLDKKALNTLKENAEKSHLILKAQTLNYIEKISNSLD